MRRLRLLGALALLLPLAGCDLATWSHQVVRARKATLAGDTAGARAAWRLAMEAAYRMDSPERRFRALLALAELAQGAGDLEAAARHLERALILVEGLYGDEAPELLEVLPLLAACSLEAGDLGRSEAVHRRWVAVVEAHPAEVTGRRTPARIALARVLADRGELPEAIQKYENALSWFRDEGGTRPEVITIQLALSRLELDRGQVDDALELAVRAADRIPGAADPPPALGAAVAQAEAWALLHQPTLRPQRISAARERARKLVAGSSDEARVLSVDRRLEATMAWMQGRLEAALELAEEGYGQALATDPPDREETWASALTLARLLEQVGPLPRADALYQRALEETVAMRGERHPRSAAIHLARARIAMVRGLQEEAADLLDIAEGDLELTWGTDLTRRFLLPGRARLELAAGRLDAALEAIREAARRWRSLGEGADPDARAEVLTILAAAHRRAGKHREAGKFASQAYRVLLQRYGDEHPAPIEPLVELARANHTLGQTDRARKAFSRALPLVEAFLDASHPWTRELPALAEELGL
jgi:tetratricopeptide (TPR) repeat protein